MRSVLVSFSLYSSLPIVLSLAYTLTPENQSLLASSHASILRPSEPSKNLVHLVKQGTPAISDRRTSPLIHIHLPFPIQELLRVLAYERTPSRSRTNPHRINIRIHIHFPLPIQESLRLLHTDAAASRLRPIIAFFFIYCSGSLCFIQSNVLVSSHRSLPSDAISDKISNKPHVFKSRS